MEMFDEDLKGIMGDRYDDGEEAVVQMPVMESKSRPKAAQQTNEVEDAQYVQIPKMEPDFMARLKGCAKWAGVCGGISMLLWWFLVNDMMVIEAAYPCILACALLTGFGVGKNVMK